MLLKWVSVSVAVTSIVAFSTSLFTLMCANMHAHLPTHKSIHPCHHPYASDYKCEPLFRFQTYLVWTVSKEGN